MVYNTLLLVAAIVLWGMNASWYPNLDGVSVYELDPTLPKKELFTNIVVAKSNAENAFSAEASLLNYCVFPTVYNELKTKTKARLIA